MIDLEELKKLAEAAKDWDWSDRSYDEDRRYSDCEVAACAYSAAANPETVLALIEQIESQKELIHALGTYAQDVPDDRGNAENLNRDKMIEDARRMLGKTLYLNYNGDKYEY